MPYPVKWYQSGMLGMPVLAANTAGSLNLMLKACLIDGFNTQAVTSATYDSGSDRVTLTFAGAHGFMKHQIIDVTGATEVNYNGEQRVTAVTTTTVKYKPAIAPAATTTGTISCDAPPVGGWVQTFYSASPSKLVLSRSSPDATPYKIVIFNDIDYASAVGNNAYIAKVEIAQNYVNETTYDIAYTAYLPAGWRQAAGEDWSLQGDHLGFYWSNQYGINSSSATFFLGDIITLRPGDTGHFMAATIPNTGVWSTTAAATHRGMVGVALNYYNPLMTGHDQLQGAVSTDFMMTGSTAVGDELNTPSAGNNGMFFFNGPWLVRESPSTTSTIRGYLPGMLALMQVDLSWHRKILEGVPWIGGASVYVNKSLYTQTNNANSYLFTVRLDDWREIVG
jgi:hypothetical protein